MIYMTSSVNLKSIYWKIFIFSLLLLVLAIISSIISTYSYVFEEKIYNKSLIVVNNTTLELLSNLSLTTYQLKLIVDVENPPVDVIAEDHEGSVIYRQKLTSIRNLFSISSRDLSTLTISCSIPSSIAIEIYALHVKKPFILLAVLSLALFTIGFPLSFGSFLYIYLNRANE